MNLHFFIIILNDPIYLLFHLFILYFKVDYNRHDTVHKNQASIQVLHEYLYRQIYKYTC